MKKKLLKNQFTLMELVVAIIIALFLFGFLLRVGMHDGKPKDSQCQMNLKTLSSSIAMTACENQGKFNINSDWISQVSDKDIGNCPNQEEWYDIENRIDKKNKYQIPYGMNRKINGVGLDLETSLSISHHPSKQILLIESQSSSFANTLPSHLKNETAKDLYIGDYSLESAPDIEGLTKENVQTKWENFFFSSCITDYKYTPKGNSMNYNRTYGTKYRARHRLDESGKNYTTSFIAFLDGHVGFTSNLADDVADSKIFLLPKVNIKGFGLESDVCK